MNVYVQQRSVPMSRANVFPLDLKGTTGVEVAEKAAAELNLSSQTSL